MGGGNHNYGNIGDTFKVASSVIANTQYIQAGIPRGNAIYFYEFSIQETSSKEDLVICIKDNEEQIKKLYDENADFTARISFMDENKIQEFDENQYKAWRTLKIIGNAKLTDIQKSKLIADLIK